LKNFAALITAVTLLCGFQRPAQAGTAELAVINQAVEALGGRDLVLGAKSLKIYGYGQLAYQDGGGNIASSPDAPQKWININGHQRVIDLEHGRTNVQQHNVQDFVFAYRRNMNGDVKVNAFLDGDVAFNVDPAGKWVRAPAIAARNRRIDMLDNPLSIVRVALEPDTQLANLHKEGVLQIFDLTTKQGDQLILAVNAETHLPAWLSWVGPHPNFGDVRYHTYFTGYQPVGGNGLNLPSGYNTISDFRNVVQQKIYIDKYEVNVPVPANLVASADVRAMAEPLPGRLPAVEAIPLGKGIWFMKVTPGGNSTLFEFDDHLVIFEAYGSEANALAVINKARETVPGKPLTQVIVSHHHIDHTGGLRAAVSEGLTVITNRQNAAYVQEVTSRPATVFPDALGRNQKPLKLMLVDRQLILKDKSMEVDVDRVVNNSHFSQGLMAYAPSAKVVAEGDLVDEGWDLVWWGNSYADSVKYWKLAVEKDLPVHGNIHTYPEVMVLLKQQTDNAVKLCADADAAHLNVQGCPASNTF
jgi:Metallo-beta-lactamase superfamily